MVKKFYFIIALFLLEILPLISAEISAEILVKPSFKLGEEIYFEYTITSDTAQEIVYTESVFCPEAPLPLLHLVAANVSSSLPIQRNYTYMQVSEEMQPQICAAIIKIISPSENIFEKNFTIDTFPEMSFNILLCKDLSCQNKSKIFMKNENIYFFFASDASTPSIKATLNYPDGTTKSINVPGSIIIEQTGAYSLAVTVSKEGYKTALLNEQFAVIEQPAEIKIVNPVVADANQFIAEEICNSDGKCSEQENSKNCPKDCKSDEVKHIILLILIGIIIFALIVIIIFISKRRAS